MFLKCGDTRIEFEVESALIRPRGNTMEERRQLLLLHHQDVDASPSPLRALFSRFRGRHQIIHVNLGMASSSETADAAGTAAKGLQLFCEKLEIRSPIVAGAGAAAVAAVTCASWFPGIISRLLLFSPRLERRLSGLGEASVPPESRIAAPASDLTWLGALTAELPVVPLDAAGRSQALIMLDRPAPLSGAEGEKLLRLAQDVGRPLAVDLNEPAQGLLQLEAGVRSFLRSKRRAVGEAAEA